MQICAGLFWSTLLLVATTSTSNAQEDNAVTTPSVSSFVAAANAVVDERAILLEFYQATSGDSWDDSTGWEDLTEDYCQWTGVLCTGDARLDDLFFGTNNDLALRRTLEEEDANADEPKDEDDDKDTRFNVQLVNKVMGLELPNNFLAGRTPQSLWDLPLLQYVNVNKNAQLQVDFSSVQKAQQLSIVKLEDTATTTLAGLDHASLTLNVLHLSGCALASAIPAELLALTNLRDLQLPKCQLEGGLAGLEALTNLRHLNLFDNDLKGNLPQGLTKLVRLEKVSLSRNQLTGDLHVLEKWTNAVEVYMAENRFTGTLPTLGGLSHLQTLYLNRNQLTGQIPAGFLAAMDSNLVVDMDSNLQVDLSRNALTGVIPSSLNVLSEVPISWTLYNNEFTGIDEALCNNTNWNRGSLRDFGCEGLLCPNGTYSLIGRASRQHSCDVCPPAQVYGSTSCVQENDRSALLALYHATKGDDWNNNEGWKDASDSPDTDDSNICEWYGIECWDGNGNADDTVGRVGAITLEANNLSGNLPEDIFGMKFLNTLKVARNPDLIVPLTGIYQSSQFRHLDIAQTATVNFDGLEAAHDYFGYLIADGLNLGGTIPTQIFNLTGLRLLSMAECELIGTLPTQLGLLTTLDELYLYDK